MLVFAKAIVFKNIKYNMREWLSGGAPPCQGGGRGFDPRLALSKDNKKDFRMGSPFLLFEKCEALLETQLLGSLGSISRRAKAPPRSCQSQGPLDLVAPVSRALR